MYSCWKMQNTVTTGASRSRARPPWESRRNFFSASGAPRLPESARGGQRERFLPGVVRRPGTPGNGDRSFARDDRAGASRLPRRISLDCGPVEHLPYEDNTFDTVAMIAAMEFTDDPLQALREACRVARRHVLLGVLNRYSLVTWLRFLDGCWNLKVGRHPRFYSVLGLHKLAGNALSGTVPMRWRTCLTMPLRGLRYFGFLERTRAFQCTSVRPFHRHEDRHHLSHEHHPGTPVRRYFPRDRPGALPPVLLARAEEEKSGRGTGPAPPSHEAQRRAFPGSDWLTVTGPHKSPPRGGPDPRGARMKWFGPRSRQAVNHAGQNRVRPCREFGAGACRAVPCQCEGARHEGGNVLSQGRRKPDGLLPLRAALPHRAGPEGRVRSPRKP